jgi:hypothetical protein
VLAFKGFANAADGAGLVVAGGDRIIQVSGEERSLGAAALDDQFQFRFLKKSLHRSRRRVRIVP